MRAVILLFALPGFVLSNERGKTSGQCYDDFGRPKRCLPPFENAAYELDVEATNTCGDDGPTVYCPFSVSSDVEPCNVCHKNQHSPLFLTDVNTKLRPTWWQSGTMKEGLQYPNMVNLTFHFKKAMDITYVRLWFRTPRPDSMGIYKKKDENSDWEPFQLYSSDCRKIYGLEDRTSVLPGEDTAPLCTSEYSGIAPLTGGNIVFSTLDGRKSAFQQYDHNQQLQEWVTATDIKIVLNRMNTFGDEAYGDERVLESYYYAIYEISIGARCKCNNHASSCITDENTGNRVCACEHLTDGVNCERCRDFYMDKPWKRGTYNDAHECEPCQCNGFSRRCFFNNTLYEQTGHGGHCMDCEANRDGPHCERCRDNYYLTEDGQCLPCHCDELGSWNLQCGVDGRCSCKPGVDGEKCDHCSADFYDFSDSGCKACNCTVAGSRGNLPNCDQTHGKCLCKENVEGKECNKCKPGYFNLDEENDFGCTPCFCYGQSTTCHAASEYSKVWIETMFARNSEKWGATDKNDNPKSLTYNSKTQDIAVTAPGREPVYFTAPVKYLGDQRASYNQDLQFRLKVVDAGVTPSFDDIILEGNRMRITQAIFGQGNPYPSQTGTTYRFRLHEHPDYGWEPNLTPRDFISILSNLTAIKIRGTYFPKGTGYLDHVKLGTAVRGAAGLPATWIEWCTCPTGYIGQFCESCAPGFRHDPPHGDAFSRCVPCNCNKHADTCDADTGQCICQHHTTGENCERCASGYYGTALTGTSDDCSPCPCPNQGACYADPHDPSEIFCTECPKGYAGSRCEECSDGYFGTLVNGTHRECKACDCNTNVDINAVNICNRETGECLKCIFNTAGFNCDQCLPGYYGDPLAPEKGDCKPCSCDSRGTRAGVDGPLLCNQVTGQCECKANIAGINCDQCKTGFYNLDSGQGCTPCNCNSTGSLDSTCDLNSGQCLCKKGVTGLQCGQCERNHYGFSSEGCSSCQCDPIGSLNLQCNETGHCPCLENVEGKNCDRCKENKYDTKRNCVNCPSCYNLVQDEVNRHRSSLSKLDKLLHDIIAMPTVLHNKEFDDNVLEVSAIVNQLWQDTKDYSGDDSELSENLNDLYQKLNTMTESLKEVEKEVSEAKVIVDNAGKNARMAYETNDNARAAINKATDYIFTEGATALQSARKLAAERGQQNKQMSDIAHQARTIVEKQLQDVEETKKAAEKALSVCNEAQLMVETAIAKQNNASRDLGVLDDKLYAAQQDMEKTINLANSTLEKVTKAYDEAFNFAVEINNLADPQVNTAGPKADAFTQKEQADRLEQEAEKFRVIYLDLTGGIEDSITESKDNLTKAIELQNEANDLLARADKAKVKAADAVELGEKTLKDAQETLQSLQDFDKKIQISKQKANEALNTVPEIEITLREAKEKTTNAMEALAGAETLTQNANEMAIAAQTKYADEASKVASETREKAEELKTEAGRLRDFADALSKKVVETGHKINQTEDQVQEIVLFTSNAKEKVGQAKNNADQASSQVENALASLASITKELNDLTDIDEDTLNQLETRLIQAENYFKNANLDEKLNEINISRLKQQQQLKFYEDQLALLEGEVDKVIKIREALPSGCYKGVGLEQD